MPRINSSWGNALAIWGQYGMSDDEHRRRRLTQTLDSSSVKANAATHKFHKQVHTYTKRIFVYEDTPRDYVFSIFSH